MNQRIERSNFQKLKIAKRSKVMIERRITIIT
jgi:hypothetical protein